MTKTQEVEIRALISKTEGEALLTKLQARGAQDTGHYYIRDVYFCPKHISRLEDVEMNAVGSYSLRLRQEKKNGKETIQLNSKTITQHGDHNAWEEHDVTIDNFEEAYAVLTRTEFKAFFDLKKMRHKFELNEYSINLEDIEDFGFALEVEVITSVDQQDATKASIRDLLASLGVSEEKIVEKSVTNLIMKQRAFK